MYTKQELKRQLAELALRPDDTVLIHSAMKPIGAVEGGADTVLDAWMEYFAPGLLVLPTLTWSIEDAHPPVFDVLRSKGQVGVLPELFRQRPGVERSWHPTHSVAAFGRDAHALICEDHLNHTPCGPTSSWHKLLERDARILMVGCDLTSCTFLHGVEEWNDVPERLKPPMRFTVVTPDGSRLAVDSSPHLGSPSEQFGRAEQALRDAGALVDGRLGDAPVLVLTAQRTNDTVSALLQKDPRLFSEGA